MPPKKKSKKVYPRRRPGETLSEPENNGRSQLPMSPRRARKLRYRRTSSLRSGISPELDRLSVSQESALVEEEDSPEEEDNPGDKVENKEEENGGKGGKGEDKADKEDEKEKDKKKNKKDEDEEEDKKDEDEEEDKKDEDEEEDKKDEDEEKDSFPTIQRPKSPGDKKDPGAGGAGASSSGPRGRRTRSNTISGNVYHPSSGNQRGNGRRTTSKSDPEDGEIIEDDSTVDSKIGDTSDAKPENNGGDKMDIETKRETSQYARKDDTASKKRNRDAMNTDSDESWDDDLVDFDSKSSTSSEDDTNKQPTENPISNPMAPAPPTHRILPQCWMTFDEDELSEPDIDWWDQFDHCNNLKWWDEGYIYTDFDSRSFAERWCKIPFTEWRRTWEIDDVRVEWLREFLDDIVPCMDSSQSLPTTSGNKPIHKGMLVAAFMYRAVQIFRLRYNYETVFLNLAKRIMMEPGLLETIPPYYRSIFCKIPHLSDFKLSLPTRNGRKRVAIAQPCESIERQLKEIRYWKVIKRRIERGLKGIPMGWMTLPDDDGYVFPHVYDDPYIFEHCPRHDPMHPFRVVPHCKRPPGKGPMRMRPMEYDASLWMSLIRSLHERDGGTLEEPHQDTKWRNRCITLHETTQGSDKQMDTLVHGCEEDMADMRKRHLIESCNDVEIYGICIRRTEAVMIRLRRMEYQISNVYNLKDRGHQREFLWLIVNVVTEVFWGKNILKEGRKEPDNLPRPVAIPDGYIISIDGYEGLELEVRERADDGMVVDSGDDDGDDVDSDEDGDDADIGGEDEEERDNASHGMPWVQVGGYNEDGEDDYATDYGGDGAYEEDDGYEEDDEGGYTDNEHGGDDGDDDDDWDSGKSFTKDDSEEKESEESEESHKSGEGDGKDDEDKMEDVKRTDDSIS
ncbi:hypothetical protein TWF730_005522 [Orbilia blumenaviensis]|uniref:Uncharacterized protein n=1 Tax=Orbilia blumenaviensis TaxID=1796055 RepID=A0AAV9VIL0_9PEZI